MKILITGANGFVGQNLLSYLKKGNELTTLSVRYESNQKININASVVIHLSGKAHDLTKIGNPQEYYHANTELTRNIFDSFLASEAKVFITISSVKAVTDKVSGKLTEDYKAKPKTHYGISKLKAEEYILSKEIPKCKKVYILRPCMIHGKGNKGNLNLLYQLVSKKIPWPLGSFDNLRSFCSIENLLFVIKEFSERDDIPSGIYNIADDDSLSTNELIGLIAESQNIKSRILNIPKKIIKNLAKIGNKLRLPLNSERLQKLTESYVVDNNKIKTVLGKEFPISTKQGLLKTFESFKGNRR
jgi:nucleoside-diphosphate-sugar epimerase